MGFIYKISNDINDKIYIGQTINNINYRFRCHANEAKNSEHQNKFHIALLEIGLEHFKVELLEKCPNEKLNERECYWIKYYDSVNNGYNTTWGGSCGIHYNRDEILQLWNEGLNITKISEKIGIDRGLLSQILKTEGITEEEIKIRHYKTTRTQKKNRKVVQINIYTGDIIKIWNRINDIERELKIHHSSIIRCCKLQSGGKTAGGYTWRYYEDYNPILDREQLLSFISKKK